MVNYHVFLPPCGDSSLMTSSTKIEGLFYVFLPPCGDSSLMTGLTAPYRISILVSTPLRGFLSDDIWYRRELSGSQVSTPLRGFLSDDEGGVVRLTLKEVSTPLRGFLSDDSPCGKRFKSSSRFYPLAGIPL